MIAHQVMNELINELMNWRLRMQQDETEEAMAKDLKALSAIFHVLLRRSLTLGHEFSICRQVSKVSGFKGSRGSR